MLPRKRFSTKLTQIMGPFYKFEYTEPIAALGMDPKGNLIINQKTATHQGNTLSGFTVIYHEASDGSLLLRQDINQGNAIPSVGRKPFIEY